MDMIGEIRDVYEIAKSIGESIALVTENKEAAHTFLSRIRTIVSSLKSLEREYKRNKTRYDDKYLNSALRSIHKEIATVEKLITDEKLGEHFTFGELFRGSKIKNHIEQAEKQVDIALRQFSFLSNVRQELNQQEILHRIENTTSKEKHRSKNSSHLEESKGGLPSLSTKCSHQSMNPQVVGLQAPVINLTVNLSSENLAHSKDKTLLEPYVKQSVRRDEPSSSRSRQPRSRPSDANLSLPQRLDDILHRLDALQHSQILRSTLDPVSPPEYYPYTRRRKVLDSRTTGDYVDYNATKILKLMREDPLPARSIASRLIALSTCLVDAGNFEKACEFGRRAISILRKTENYKLDRFFGSALHYCSYFYRNSGNHSEALRFAQDAVAVFSNIYHLNKGQEKAAVDLGMTLNTLGYALSSVNLTDEATDACRRSVELFRTLNHHSSNKYQANLALCMVNYANCMLVSRLFSEAVRVSSAASQIYQSCYYGVEGGKYSCEYGVCLSIQANCLLAYGHVQEALAVINSSIPIFNELNARFPGLFNHELANVCLSRFKVYFELSQYADARGMVLECLGLFRQFASKNPGSYDVDLSDALTCSAKLNIRENRFENANHDLQEALSILSPGACYSNKTNLARALELAAMCWRKLKEYRNAKDRAQQAVDIRRDLASHQTDGQLYHWRPIQLAEALLELGRCRADLHLNDKASFELLQNVTEIYRSINRAQTFWLAKDLCKIAQGLHSLSQLQVAIKDRSAALQSVRDAVKYLEAASAQRSDLPVKAGFVKIYLTQSSLYSQFDHHDQALDSARRAVEMANILSEDGTRNGLLELAKKRFQACDTTMEQYFFQSMSHLVSAGPTKHTKY